MNKDELIKAMREAVNPLQPSFGIVAQPILEACAEAALTLMSREWVEDSETIILEDDGSNNGVSKWYKVKTECYAYFDEVANSWVDENGECIYVTHFIDNPLPTPPKQ